MIIVAMKNSRKLSRDRVSPLRRVVRKATQAIKRVVVNRPKQAIHATITFGANNIVKTTLPWNTPRQKIRQVLRQKYHSITEAELMFPNSDKPVVLEFGVVTASNLDPS